LADNKFDALVAATVVFEEFGKSRESTATEVADKAVQVANAVLAEGVDEDKAFVFGLNLAQAYILGDDLEAVASTLTTVPDIKYVAISVFFPPSLKNIIDELSNIVIDVRPKNADDDTDWLNITDALKKALPLREEFNKEIIEAGNNGVSLQVRKYLVNVFNNFLALSKAIFSNKANERTSAKGTVSVSKDVRKSIVTLNNTKIIDVPTKGGKRRNRIRVTRKRRRGCRRNTRKQRRRYRY
jgi:hypothetical protein